MPPGRGYRRAFRFITPREGWQSSEGGLIVCLVGKERYPSASATELEILAVRGFGDIGPQARTRMVRNRFISEQQSCRQRRHLDSLPPDTSIREIVDRCRVWESHSKLGREPPQNVRKEAKRNVQFRCRILNRYQMEVASD